ncbi:MAG: ATP-binding cassette domain-containing protein [Paludibacteraceae bacterium]
MPIRIEHLNKTIKKQVVLHDISLSIADGEIVGLLGPNGAGKSTLMKILVRLWMPDVATDKECRTIVKVPNEIGYLPEQNPLYEDMYVDEYLCFMGRITMPKASRKDINTRVDELVERVGLTPEVHKKIGQLSKGYKQRVGLAQALLGDPDLLILDEPTTGLDPNQLQDIRSLIRELGKDKTVILSTHIMQEVREMCNRVVILHHGELRADKPTREVDDLEKLFRDCTQS